MGFDKVLLDALLGRNGGASDPLGINDPLGIMGKSGSGIGTSIIGKLLGMEEDEGSDAPAYGQNYGGITPVQTQSDAQSASGGSAKGGLGALGSLFGGK